LAESLELYLEDGSLDLKTSQMYLNEYLNVYRGVKEYQEKQKSFLQQFGYVKTLFGRKRWIKLTGDTKLDEEAYRKAGNTPVQGTASDINTMAFFMLIKLYRQEGYKSFPISVIHDAIMFELHDDESFLKELNLCVMENLQLPFLTDVKLKVDWSEGATWGETKGK
jgi:DNA polymerase-1